MTQIPEDWSWLTSWFIIKGIILSLLLTTLVTAQAYSLTDIGEISKFTKDSNLWVKAANTTAVGTLAVQNYTLCKGLCSIPLEVNASSLQTKNVMFITDIKYPYVLKQYDTRLEPYYINKPIEDKENPNGTKDNWVLDGYKNVSNYYEINEKDITLNPRSNNKFTVEYYQKDDGLYKFSVGLADAITQKTILWIEPTSNGTKGLIANWTFDDTSGTQLTDRGPYGYNCVVSFSGGGGWITAGCAKSGCAYFGAGSYANCGTTPALNLANYTYMTWCMWVNSNVNNGDYLADNSKMYLTHGTNVWSWNFNGVANSTNAITNNVLTHICVVRTPTNDYGYTNGILTTVGGHSEVNYAGAVFIGARAVGSGTEEKKVMDEMVIWDAAFPAADILVMYQEPSSSSSSSSSSIVSMGSTSSSWYSSSSTSSSSSSSIIASSSSSSSLIVSSSSSSSIISSSSSSSIVSTSSRRSSTSSSSSSSINSISTSSSSSSSIISSSSSSVFQSSSSLQSSVISSAITSYLISSSSSTSSSSSSSMNSISTSSSSSSSIISSTSSSSSSSILSSSSSSSTSSSSSILVSSSAESSSSSSSIISSSVESSSSSSSSSSSLIAAPTTLPFCTGSLANCGSIDNENDCNNSYTWYGIYHQCEWSVVCSVATGECDISVVVSSSSSSSSSMLSSVASSGVSSMLASSSSSSSSIPFHTTSISSSSSSSSSSKISTSSSSSSSSIVSTSSRRSSTSSSSSSSMKSTSSRSSSSSSSSRISTSSRSSSSSSTSQSSSSRMSSSSKISSSSSSSSSLAKITSMVSSSSLVSSSSSSSMRSSSIISSSSSSSTSSSKLSRATNLVTSSSSSSSTSSSSSVVRSSSIASSSSSSSSSIPPMIYECNKTTSHISSGDSASFYTLQAFKDKAYLAYFTLTYPNGTVLTYPATIFYDIGGNTYSNYTLIAFPSYDVIYTYQCCTDLTLLHRCVNGGTIMPTSECGNYFYTKQIAKYVLCLYQNSFGGDV